MWATNIGPIYSISSIYGIPLGGTTTRRACFHHNRLTTRWIVDAVRLIVCCEWRLRYGWLKSMYQYWRIVSWVKLYSCCCLLTWLMAAQRLCTSFDVRRRVVPSSNCIPYYLKGIVCLAHLAVPFWLIIHWYVGALGSALPSTLDSNHALWNLRTAWQYSPMSYRMLHYIDFVNAFTNSPT